jgi:hypothetical protein
MQDFRELNQNSHIDKYWMKEITGVIGRANSTIFTTLDLTSEFWQMQLDEDSQKLTAFTIPGKGQFHWITSPMGLLGCPASFQCLMEGVLRDIPNVLVYIDNLLVHTDTHEKHLQVLDQVLARLHKNHLKINLEKCVFGNKKVSYLGFTLTPDGIKPGKNKLKAIKDAKPPTDIKTIRSFVGLCNFFRTHIKDFALIAAPLFKLTRKDSGYKSGPLPEKEGFLHPTKTTHVRTGQNQIDNMRSSPMPLREQRTLQEALGPSSPKWIRRGTFTQSLLPQGNSRTMK